MKSTKELQIEAKKIRALSENGQHHYGNDYNLERYQELNEISKRMIRLVTMSTAGQKDTFLDKINVCRMPQVDFRAIIFNDMDLILMTSEKNNEKWSMTGAWDRYRFQFNIEKRKPHYRD